LGALASVHESASLTVEQTPLEEELRKLVASDVVADGLDNAADERVPLINRSGLNGLATSGTDGLRSGVFQVAAAQPINYVVEEIEGLFNLDNEGAA
jgi:hypothetical protein